MSKGKYYFSKSLEKGLKILSLFNRETPVLTQSEIAKTLALNMTSTYRYINTLVELGYLEKDAKTKEIRPSILCLLFCANLMRATDHLRMIKEVVNRIHKEKNISIDVAFAVDDTLVRIYYRGADETLTYSLPDFSKNCLHNTALGKAYLSSLPDDLIAEKIENMVLTGKTEKTITDKAVLLADLKKAKGRQYAMSEEEYLPGLITISAPLFDPLTGKGVGAVCFDFSVLQHSAQDVEAKYGRLIRETAGTLSELLPPDKDRRN
ncbi:IclR family transcriptional regulator [Desulfosarcina alkanivorans]|uniref:IclR family transcriptional regulator n=1 Tax=Desulfosarcina alkanivorans TaxID=571177 RepID=A0A5K7YIE9_9BACT|nr:IclR family transcriptional regulator [Desulfosarcina alkanivorans]BBO67860.1 IclR family transcriptional regulator [Desulfosarcina alkanivorans]